MEKDTLHRAADHITLLLKAHVSDSAENVDIHDAIAARDDLRELAYELDESEGYDIPEIGETYIDNSPPHWSADNRVKVVDVKSGEARTTYFETDTGKRSVAYANPDHPDDAPVAVVQYVNGSGKEYHFPVTRLD